MEMLTKNRNTKIIKSYFNSNNKLRHGDIIGCNGGVEFEANLGNVKVDSIDIGGPLSILYGTNVEVENDLESKDEIDTAGSLTVGGDCISKYGLKVGGNLIANIAQAAYITILDRVIIKNYIRSQGKISLGKIIAKDLQCGGDATIDGDAEFSGSASSDGVFRVGNDLTVFENFKSQHLEVRGNVNVRNMLKVLRDAKIGGDFLVEGVAEIGGHIFIDGDIINTYIKCPNNIKLKGSIR